ncbi:MAG TPA: ABC transporter substrate-binding protein [Thermoleophilia bacterium]|nr:ABC transporter substrate-binding protein [Thermoleophilia bacterium]
MKRRRTRGRTSTFARAAVTAALVVPLLAVTAACGDPAPAARATPLPVRIGAIYNLTGDQSALDSPSLDGARLAVERINARGGLLGRRVELLERDGQTSAANVRRAAASLVASGVTAIVGLSDTDQVLAAAPIAARAGVPFVTSGATSPRLTEQVPDWLFLACFGDNTQAAASAQYASDRLGARTAAVLYDKDLDYTRLLAKYFTRSLRAQGGRVLVSADFENASHAIQRLDDGGSSSEGAAGEEGEEASGGSDASSGGESAGGEQSSESSGKATDTANQAATADVLFVAAGPEDAPRIVRDLRAAGYRQPIMGGDSFDSAALISAAEKSGGKVYYTTHSAVGMNTASNAVRRFDASFRAAYGRLPQSAFAGLGYDAVGLVASAVRRADSAEPSKVRDAIQATRHYPGVTGTLSFDGEDRVPRKKVTVVCVGRRPVVVAQFTPGFVADP